MGSLQIKCAEPGQASIPWQTWHAWPGTPGKWQALLHRCIAAPFLSEKHETHEMDTKKRNSSLPASLRSALDGTPVGIAVQSQHIPAELQLY